MKIWTILLVTLFVLLLGVIMVASTTPGIYVNPSELFCINASGSVTTICEENSTLYVNTSQVCTKNNSLCSASVVNGTNGANGTGILSIYLLANGSLQINLSDGVNVTTGNLTGVQGATGATGATGAAGAAGINGTDGSNASVTSGDLYINVTNGVVSVNTSHFDLRYALVVALTAEGLQRVGNDSLKYDASNPQSYYNSSTLPGSDASSGWVNGTTQVWLANNGTNVSIGSTPTLLVDPSNGIVSIGTDNPIGRSQVSLATQELPLHVYSTADKNTIYLVQNNNSFGANSAAIVRTKADVANMNFQSHGSNRTVSRFGVTLASWNEFLAVTGNGFVVGTASGPLIFGTVSTRAVTISTGQLVGIGNSDPKYLLDINGSAPVINIVSTSATGARIFFNNTGGTVTGTWDLITRTTDGRMSFRKNASNALEYMSITESGRIGINAIEPLATLHINGTSVRVDNSTGSAVFFVNTTATGGYVGVGTAEPKVNLHIYGPGTTDRFLGIGEDPSGPGNCSFNMGYSGFSFGVGTGFYNLRPCTGATNQRYAWLIAGTERMQINNTNLKVSTNQTIEGSLGIGTTTPSQKLHVVGNTNITGTEYVGVVYAGITNPMTSASAVIAFESLEAQRFSASASNAPNMVFSRARGTEASPTNVSLGDETGRFLFRGYNGSTLYSSARFGAIVDGAVSNTEVPQAIYFQTGNGTTPTERMRITSFGNVGIGTTTPTQALHVVGSANITTRLYLTPVGITTCNTGQEGAVYYNITTHKHYGCNSTAWNALY